MLRFIYLVVFLFPLFGTSQKSTYRLILEDSFALANQQMERSMYAFELYNFHLAIPLEGVLFEKDKASKQFFSYSQNQANGLQSLSQLVLILADSKKNTLTKQLDSVSLCSHFTSIPYFYVAIFGLSKLSVTEQPAIAKQFKAQLEVLERDRSRPTYEQETVLFKHLHFLLNYFLLTNNEEKLLFLRSPFYLSDLDLFHYLPLAERTPGIQYPSDLKERVYKQIAGTLDKETKTDLLLHFFIENPTKQKRQALQRTFKKSSDCVKRIELQFDFTYPKFICSPEVCEYLQANQKNHNWVVLDIWGTWCSPCVDELPNWQHFYETQHQLLGLNFIAMSAFSEDAEAFLQARNFTFPNRAISKESLKLMGIEHFPSTYLISPNGHVVEIPFTADKIALIRLLTGN